MLAISQRLLAEAYQTMSRCGQGRAECVTYMIGPAGDPTLVDELVHPRHIGTPTFYQVDNQWLNDFWLDLAARRKSVRIQIHTHRGAAFHSKTDDDWPLIHTPGFLSLVIPNLAKGAPDLTGAFLAEYLSNGRWKPCTVRERIRLT